VIVQSARAKGGARRNTKRCGLLPYAVAGLVVGLVITGLVVLFRHLK
jgi:hypothetical protein